MNCIFIVETAGDMQQFSTKDGMMLAQTVKLREIGQGPKYAQRWLVDNVSGRDLKPYIGKPVGCCLENWVSTSKEGREFNNIRIREVVILAEDESNKSF